MRILVLAPHTDDGELGCGGTIARFTSEGHKVFYVAFSAAEKSIPAGFPPDVLRREVAAATKRLGVPDTCLKVLNYEVRDFPVHRQEILDDMIKLSEWTKPDMVFLPCRNDTHQDHQVISAEGFRAFKKTTILGYELPWNNLTFTTSAFVVLTEEQLSLKVSSLEEYESQAHRGVVNSRLVRALTAVRGSQIGVKYAETFEVMRWVMQ